MHRRAPLVICAFALCAAPALAQTAWTGAISSAWNTSGNWTAGVPTDQVDAVVQSIGNAPLIDAGFPACRSLTVEDGATVTLQISLRIMGDLIVEGSGQITGSGLVRVNGDPGGILRMDPGATGRVADIQIATQGIYRVLDEFRVDSILVNAGGAGLRLGSSAASQSGHLSISGAATLRAAMRDEFDGRIEVGSNLILEPIAVQAEPWPDLVVDGDLTTNANVQMGNGRVTMLATGSGIIPNGARLHDLEVPAGVQLDFVGTLELDGSAFIDGSIRTGTLQFRPTAGGERLQMGSAGDVQDVDVIGELTIDGGEITDLLISDPNELGITDVTIAGTVTADIVTIENSASDLFGDASATLIVLARLEAGGRFNFLGTLDVRGTMEMMPTSTFTPAGGAIRFTGVGKKRLTSTSNNNPRPAEISVAAETELEMDSVGEIGQLTVAGTVSVLDWSNVNTEPSDVFANTVLVEAGGDFTYADTTEEMTVGNLTVLSTGSATLNAGAHVVAGDLALAGSLTLLPGATLAATGAGTVSGIIPAGIPLNGDYTIDGASFQGTLDHTGGSLTVGQATVGQNAVLTGTSIVGSAEAGNLDVAGDVTLNPTTATTTAPDVIEVGGQWSSNANFQPTQGIVRFDGTSQTATIGGQLSTIEVDAGATVDIATALTAGGLDLEGTLRVAGSTVTVTGTAVVGGTGRLEASNATTVEFGGTADVSGDVDAPLAVLTAMGNLTVAAAGTVDAVRVTAQGNATIDGAILASAQPGRLTFESLGDATVAVRNATLAELSTLPNGGGSYEVDSCTIDTVDHDAAGAMNFVGDNVINAGLIVNATRPALESSITGPAGGSLTVPSIDSNGTFVYGGTLLGVQSVTIHFTSTFTPAGGAVRFLRDATITSEPATSPSSLGAAVEVDNGAVVSFVNVRVPSLAVRAGSQVAFDVLSPFVRPFDDATVGTGGSLRVDHNPSPPSSLPVGDLSVDGTVTLVAGTGAPPQIDFGRLTIGAGGRVVTDDARIFVADDYDNAGTFELTQGVDVELAGSVVRGVVPDSANGAIVSGSPVLLDGADFLGSVRMTGARTEVESAIARTNLLFAGSELVPTPAEAGELVVEGDLDWQPTAVLTELPTIRCRGDWLGSAAVAPASGRVVFDGRGAVVALHDLELANAIHLLGSDGADVGGSVTVDPSGGLDVGQHSLTIRQGTIAADGELSVGAGGALILDSGNAPGSAALTVGTTGTLRVVGSAGLPAVVAGNAGGDYGCTIEGTLHASEFEFRHMGRNGIDVRASATFGTPVSGGLFTAGSAAGNSTLLRLERSAATTLTDIVFDNIDGTATFNVASTSNVPIQLVRANGNFAGESFESDLNGIIDWVPFDRTEATMTALGQLHRNEITITTTREVDVAGLVLVQEIGGVATGAVNLSPTGTPTAGAAYQFTDIGLNPLTAHTYRLFEQHTRGVLRELATAAATPVPQQFGRVTVVGDGGFASIDAAIAAAPDRGTVLVEGGIHDPFTLTRPIRVIGFGDDPVQIDTSSQPVLVENLPAGSFATLAGLEIGDASSGFGLIVRNNAETVVLDDLRVRADPTAVPAVAAIRVESCPHIAIQNADVTGAPGLSIASSTVVVTGGAIDRLEADAGAAVTIAGVVPGSQSTAGGATIDPRPGFVPRLDFDNFWTDASDLELSLSGDPSASWALLTGAIRGYRSLAPIPLDLVLLLDLNTLFVANSGTFDPSGAATLTLTRPSQPALWGISLPLQLLQVRPDFTGRFGNLRDLVVIP